MNIPQSDDKQSDQPFAAELAFCREMAKQAGAIIKDEFSRSQSVSIKADNSPVTLIDTKINTMVADAVQQTFPDDRFDGEEGGGGSVAAERVWICDPIDGTTSFLLRVPASMFMLGLFVQGVEQVAVAYNPMTEEMFEAVKGGGACKNGQALHVSKEAAASHAIIVVDSKVYQESTEAIAVLESLGYQVVGVSGSGTKVMKVAEGLAAGMFRTNGDYHDIGVGALIAEEAGAVVSSLQNNQLLGNDFKIYDGYIIANAATHADIKGAVHKQ